MAGSTLGTAAWSQTASQVTPLKAELILPLDASRVKVGLRVKARAAGSWSGGGCNLRNADIIEGYVSQVVRRTKTDRTSAIHIVFDKGNCDDHGLVELKLRVVALIGPFGTPSPAGESGTSEGPPLADLPLSINGTGGHAGAAMRSAETAAFTDQYALAGATRKLPTQILPGQVIDLPKMNLAVGTGVDGGSIVYAKGTDARLEARTTLVLIPTPKETEVAVNAAGTAAAGAPSSLANSVAGETAESVAARTTRPKGETAKAIGVVDAADETEICSAGCNGVSSSDLRGEAVTAVSATLPIRQLGFAPHEKRLALAFDQETAITYLDEHHLLCTFDPHGLRTRSSNDMEAMHSIRAVLVDPTTQKIIRVVEWRVRGDGSYLWKFGEGQVLVHVGDQLKLLDAELHTLRSVPVSGPIEWVVSSPSRDHVAVAVLKRRSLDNGTAREEELSTEGIAPAPERDLEVKVYDEELRAIAGSMRPVTTHAPVLSDGGELRVQHVSHGRWKIVEFGWDKTERDLATVRTACRPLASSPEHGLVFVTGCAGTTGRTWYRMLREDGHPLLKAESPSDEIDQTAEGATSGAFAVRVLKTTKPITVDQPYEREDLAKEEIAVYRSSDGAKVSSVVTKDFILAQNSYALSPSGDQMAVVGKESILFYPVNLNR